MGLLFPLKIKWLSLPDGRDRKGLAFSTLPVQIHEIPNQLHPYQGPLL